MRTKHITRILLPLFLLAGCKQDQSAAVNADETLVPTEAARTAPVPAVAVDLAGSPAQQGEASAAPPTLTRTDAAATDSAPSAPLMIIRTGKATVRVDSLETAVAQVKALATRVGGYVSSSNESTGSQNVRQATLELKVPSARWDQTLAGIRPLGTLESQQSSSEDVGEEFVDVTARVGNSRRLEARLLDLLATRTGKLDDVLSVEHELARVREEIDRYEGRLRYLRSRVSLSTLTVELHEPYPTLGPGSNPIVDAFRTASRNFVGFLAGFIASLGWLVPLLAIGWGVWWLVRRVMASRRRNPPPPAAPKPPTPPPAS